MVARDMVENEGQRALRLWITAGLAIPEVVAMHVESDAKYLFRNMIPKYTSAASSYRISTLALDEFRRQRVDLTKTWKRSRFYGSKNVFKYEHVIPAAIVLKKLLASDRRSETVHRILSESGFVAVLLKEQDQLLNSAGLRAKMPDGWEWGDDPLERYRVVGIELSDRVLKVNGAIMR